MIDLIDECGADLKELGYQKFETGKYSLCKGKICVDSPQKAKQTGFEEGNYVILNCPMLHLYKNDIENYVCDQLSKEIKNLAKKHKLSKKSRILIVGLGNPQIMADSLGSKVLDCIKLDVMKKDLRICKFAPNIFYNTGLNSFDVVSLLTLAFDFDCVMVIDALATTSVNRLSTSIQLNDVGMTPASAVNNLGQKICQQSLGVPCLSIGVPTMLLAGKVLKNAPMQTILTPKDNHEEINLLAKIISKAIIKAL